MTETSYTAWDDKLYQWPPPDGWYQATDGKWWPEGYGPDPIDEPQPAEEAGIEEAAPPAELADVAEAADHRVEDDPAVGSADPVDQVVASGPWAEIGGQNGRVSAGAVGDLVAGAGGPLSTAVEDGPTWNDLTASAGDAGTDVLGDVADGLSSTVSEGADDLGEAVEGVSAADVPGLGDLPDAMPDPLLGQTSELPSGFSSGFGDADMDATQVIPSDLSRPSDAVLPTSSPDLGLQAPAGDAPSGDQASLAPPPPGAGDAVSFDAPAPSPGVPSFETPVFDPTAFEAPAPGGSSGDGPSFDTPSFDAPSFDAPALDAPSFDAPSAEAPALEAPAFETPVFDPSAFEAPAPGGSSGDGPSFDTPSFDAPALDAPSFEAPSFDSPSFDAPPPGPIDGSGTVPPVDGLPADAPGFDAPSGGESEGSVTDLDALPPPSLGDAARAFTALGGGDPLSPSNLDQPLAGPAGGDLPQPDSPGDGVLGTDIPDIEVPSAESAQGAVPSFDVPPSFAPSDAGTTNHFDPSAGATPGGLDGLGIGAPAGPDQAAPGFSAPLETGQLFGGSPDQAAWSPDQSLGRPEPLAPPPGPAPDQPGGAGGWAPQPYDGSGQIPGFDQSALLEPDDAPGSSKTVLLVVIGVVALLVICAGLYFLLGNGDGDATDGGDEGSFSNPHARSTGVEVSYPSNDTDRQWVVEVLEPARDASAEGNSIPEDDEMFAATRIRVRNQALELSAPIGELRFNAVTGDGEVIDREAKSCSVSADPFDFAAALPPGGSTEGTVCWQVPTGSVAGLLLGVESTEVGGRVHIKMD